MAKDLYEVLGVSRQASPQEIKAAYRRLARQYHPDVNPGNKEAEERFKEISAAHDILSDEEKRARYDQFGSTDGPTGGPGDFFGGQGFDLGDIFETFFGGGTQQRRRNGVDGQDLKARVELDLRDVVAGVSKQIRYDRPKRCGSCQGTGVEGGKAPETCPQCNGTGSVTRIQQTFLGQVRTSTTCPNCRGEGVIIKDPCRTCKGRKLVLTQEELAVDVPAGVEDGMSIRFQGRGGEGLGQGSNGDLYVEVDIAADDRFLRDGIHVRTALEISFAQAALGDTVKIDGVAEEVEVTIPPGTQPGTELRVKGLGVPPLRGGPRGDLYVQIQVVVPTKLSEAEIKLIRDLAALRGERDPQGDGDTSLLGGLFKKRKG